MEMRDMRPKVSMKIFRLVVCAMLVLSTALILPVPKVSAQGSCTETTDTDFNDNTLTGVKIVGSGVPAYVELDKTEQFTWLNRSATGPPKREGFAMAYDAFNQKTVMFGGMDAMLNFLDDTWEYDYGTNTWTEIFPSTKPSPRADHKMVYDSFNQVIVLFGGWFDDGMNLYIYDHTWEYDVTTKEWAQVFPATKPSARASHAMTYDSANQRVILFAGVDDMTMTIYSDTWAYNAASDSWAPRASGPGARLLHAMAYDSTNNVHVLHAGFGISGMTPIYYDDTWEYNYGTNSWVETTDLMGPSPGHRIKHTMAFHAGVHWTILFGGVDSQVADYKNDTWAYDPTMVAPKFEWWPDGYAPPVLAPEPRQGHGMVYDSVNDLILLFGGVGETSGLLSETWELITSTVYVSLGSMESDGCNSGELPPEPKWGMVYWNPTSQPIGTEVKVQLANSTDGLSWGLFVGPDGSGGSYYTDPTGAAESIKGHDGKQYLKYKAYLSTSNPAVTPTLEDITITWGVGLLAPRNLVVGRTPPNDITLSWDISPGATEYRIYESQDRFAAWPWTLLGTSGTIQYTHGGALTDGITHYYIVRAFDGLTETGNSSMGAKIELSFTQSGNPNLTDINWLSLPYNSIYTTASDIANELTDAKIKAVGKWNPAKQRAIMYTFAKSKWKGPDFTISPGEGVFIAGLQQNFNWVITGTDLEPTLNFVHYPKYNKFINWISVPYTGIYDSASSIVLDIEGSTMTPPAKIVEVGKWNPATQTSERYYWDGGAWIGTDFTVDPGDGIYLQIISDFGWPITLITPSVP